MCPKAKPPLALSPPPPTHTHAPSRPAPHTHAQSHPTHPTARPRFSPSVSQHSRCAGMVWYLGVCEWHGTLVCVSAMQLVALAAGEVDFGTGTTFLCPIASTFRDAFGGLYGPRSFLADSCTVGIAIV